MGLSYIPDSLACTACTCLTGLQGKMLRHLGVGWSLTAVPVVSAVLMAATAVHPSVVTVGFADVLRKVRPIACKCLARCC